MSSKRTKAEQAAWDRVFGGSRQDGGETPGDELLTPQEVSRSRSTEQAEASDRLAAIFRSPSIRGMRPRHTETTQLKLKVDPDVHRKALAKGKLNGVNVSLMVEEVLKAWLAEGEK